MKKWSIKKAETNRPEEVMFQNNLQMEWIYQETEAFHDSVSSKSPPLIFYLCISILLPFISSLLLLNKVFVMQETHLPSPP